MVWVIAKQKASKINGPNSVQAPSLQHKFSQSLSETLAIIANNNYEYYLLGDININPLNATNDNRIQQYII